MEIYWCEFSVVMSHWDDTTTQFLDDVAQHVSENFVGDVTYMTAPAERSVRFGMSAQVTALLPPEQIPPAVVSAVRTAILFRGGRTLGWPEPVNVSHVNMEPISVGATVNA